MPADDPTWPECNTLHVTQSAWPIKHWCDNTREKLVMTLDAEEIEPGLRYCVPVVPTADMYAEVSIDPQSFANGKAAMMYLCRPLNTPTDPFGLTADEEQLSLGMWNKGEGRLVMASAIADWTQANTVSKCNKTSHDFQNEMILKQGLTNEPNTDFTKCNTWTMAFYEMCYVCFAKTGGGDPNVLAPQNFNAQQFGLGPDNFKPDYIASQPQNNSMPANNGFQSQEERTKSLLQQRFGT